MNVNLFLRTTLMIALIASLGTSCDPFERRGSNADDSKAREVEAIWRTLPRYAGMTEVHSMTTSTAQRVLVSKHFKSSASIDEVKQFYVKTLSDEGWQLVEDRKMSDWGRDLGGHYLAFRKAEYRLSIQYAGTANEDWDYGISIGWGDR